MLTEQERERYDRQIMMRDIGEHGQERLKRARVFIAGAGGLGSPVCLYLATAGVGMIRVVDHDSVELSNLNRQVLHWEQDIGKTDKGRLSNPEAQEAEPSSYHRTHRGDNHRGQCLPACGRV